MKGKFRTPIWVIPALALLLIIGAVAVMTGLNQYSAGPAEANIFDNGDLTKVQVELGNGNPIVATSHTTASHVVAGSLTINNEPKRSRAQAKFTMKFKTLGATQVGTGAASAAGLVEVGDEIIFQFGRRWLVPDIIAASAVTIAASQITNAGVAGCTAAGETRTATTVTVEGGLGDRNAAWDVRVQVPDMNTSDSCPGDNDIDSGSDVTVIFSQSSGILNVGEANDPGRQISVRATGDPRPVVTATGDQLFVEVAKVPIPLRAELSRERGDRGSTVTLIASGPKNGLTATFWLDANNNGVRDGAETDLCSEIVSSWIATCAATVSNPPFSPGQGFSSKDSGEDLDAGISATDTSISVADFSKFNKGQTILIDLERMLIREIATTDSGETLAADISETADTLTMADSSGFDVGQTVQIGSERMLITGIPGGGTTLTVTRKSSGTTAATHDEDDVISIVSLTVERATLGTVAILHDVAAAISAVSFNFINVRDGVNKNVFTTTSSIFDQTQLDRSVFILRATVRLSPNTANVGDRVTVSLFDYPEANVDRIDLGGVRIDKNTVPSLGDLTTGLSTIPKSGQESFTFEVPGTVNGVRIPTGSLRFQVRHDFDDPITGKAPVETEKFATLTVGGANLTISQETVVPNQDLTISGSGFTETTSTTGQICIEENLITLANVPLVFDEDDIDCTRTRGDPAVVIRGKKLSSGGTFTLTTRVADVGAEEDINVALFSEGSHELKVIDTNGSEGTLQVSIADRTLEVTPASARPRDIITVVGKAFIADNPDGLSSTVEVKYECGGAAPRLTTADADGSGNFRVTLRIPSGCAIPATNTITASIDSAVGIVDTVTHEIPDALVRIEPARGPSGGLVSVSGEGFRTFEIVTAVEFAGRGTLGGRTVNTDGSGNFEITDLLVPGLDPGIRSVVVKVGTGTRETSSSTSFEVLEPGVVGIPTAIEEALAPLGDNLVRAFNFNNVTKTWTFYDPRPEFADANTLSEFVTNAVYWVRIVDDVTVDLNFIERNLSCVQEDCWNLIVY